MKVVIIGANGFVGSSLIRYFKTTQNDLSIYTIERSFFEMSSLTDNADIQKLFDYIYYISEIDNQPTICINLLSASNVDFCEKNPTLSEFVNYSFPKELYARLIELSKIRVISFSSNAVYCGNKAPYTEDSEFSPVNYYGEHKALLDTFIRQELASVIIIRPTTLFGIPMEGNRSNPVYDLINKAKAGDEVKLVTDLLVNFGYVNDLCKAIGRLITDGDQRGEYNFGGPKTFSRYSLGLLIYEYFNAPIELINAAQMVDFKSSAMRPRDTSFECKRFDNRFGFRRTSVDTYLSLAS